VSDTAAKQRVSKEMAAYEQRLKLGRQDWSVDEIIAQARLLTDAKRSKRKPSARR
jgi:hypothetical protein